MTGSIKALVVCQNDYCAEQQSYPLGMVRMWDGQPICQSCYDDGDYNPDGCHWNDLPPVTLADLKE
jgi:hypothetical protein